MSQIWQNSFPENMFAPFRDINTPFWREIFYRMYQIWQNSFPENRFDPFRDINTPFWREIFYRMYQIWQNSFPENRFDPFRDINIPRLAQIILSDVPNSAKLISGKHVCPFSGHQHPPFGANYFVGCPKFGKTHFRKTGLPLFGTSTPRFGAQMCIFFARRFWNLNNLVAFHTIYHVGESVLKKFRKLPSARRIFPKVFRRSHFWTSILVHFLRNFLTLVQIESKK